MWVSVEVVVGVRIVQCHAVMDVVIGVRVMLCYQAIMFHPLLWGGGGGSWSGKASTTLHCTPIRHTQAQETPQCLFLLFFFFAFR